MKALLRVIFDTFFVFILFIGSLFKSILHVISLLGLRLQEANFKISKANLRRRQENEFRRINNRHTRIHLKELADLLEAELIQYQKDISNQDFYRLKGMIARSLNRGDLEKLTKLHTILFEIPKEQVLTKLMKFLRKN